MKKLTLFALSLILLSGCVYPKFYPYTGDKEVIGEGGMITERKKNVDFYNVGLPQGSVCKLLGRVSYNDGFQIHNRLADSILKAGGNTGSMSVIQLRSNLDNSNKENNGTDTLSDSISGYGNGIAYAYVVYNCQ